jgi:LacI family transcriptional regulator
MVKHLASLGHKNIYCLTPIQGRIIHNPENFRHAIQANGLPFDESHFIENTGSWAALGKLHKEDRMPDAFFCIGDMNAITLIKDLQKMGYQVPKDVAVVGYNNIDLCKYTTPEITTVDNHIDKMAGLATKLLIEKIEGSGYEEMNVEIEAELVIRESCGNGLKKQ